MKVKHAIISAGLLKEIESGKKVYNEYNEIGLERALSEGIKIYVKRKIQLNNEEV